MGEDQHEARSRRSDRQSAPAWPTKRQSRGPTTGVAWPGRSTDWPPSEPAGNLEGAGGAGVPFTGVGSWHPRTAGTAAGLTFYPGPMPGRHTERVVETVHRDGAATPGETERDTPGPLRVVEVLRETVTADTTAPVGGPATEDSAGETTDSSTGRSGESEATTARRDGPPATADAVESVLDWRPRGHGAVPDRPSPAEGRPVGRGTGSDQPAASVWPPRRSGSTPRPRTTAELTQVLRRTRTAAERHEMTTETDTRHSVASTETTPRRDRSPGPQDSRTASATPKRGTPSADTTFASPSEGRGPDESLVWSPSAGQTADHAPGPLPSATDRRRPPGLTSAVVEPAAVEPRVSVPSTAVAGPATTGAGLTFRTPAPTGRVLSNTGPSESATTPLRDDVSIAEPPAPDTRSTHGPGTALNAGVEPATAPREASPFTEFPDTDAVVDHLYDLFQRRNRLDRERRGL